MTSTGVRVKRSLRRPVRSTLALALLLASSAAAALGLGQIELKSKIGEPFVAEIPIISSDPSELEQLRAGMPSPETFARIGLQEPDALVSSLRFTSALDAQGRPVIRVTSEQPINEPLLNFLVEVEWGQGRLVREYSALVAPPRTVAAPIQPPIEAAQAAPSNAIIREPAAPAATARTVPAPAAAPAPTPTPTPIATQPAPVATPAPSAPPANPVADTLRTVRVRPGQSLSQIASDVRGDVSLEQAMVALLRANPDAFIDGDINQLKRGAVLRVPAQGALGDVDAGEAGALVRTQVERWQQSRRPIATPDAPEPSAAQATATATPAAPAIRTTPAPATRAAQRSRARLEIVPPGASSARQAGTQSGLAAGGTGTMLRQEMQQTQETLAAREVELAEMKARVAELEALQKQQAQLITLKDSQLAAAQQRLAQSQQAAPAREANPWPWAAGLLALLVLGALAAWFSRRQARARSFQAPRTEPAVRSSPLADAFAGGVATPAPARAAAEASIAPAPVATAAVAAGTLGPAKGRGARAKARASAPEPAMRAGAAEAPGTPASAQPAPPAAAAPVEATAPAAAGEVEAVTPAPATKPVLFTTPAPPPATAPTWHATTRAGVAASAASPTGDASAAGGNERLELARAYLDLGDQASARQLLVELVVNGDHASRQQASKLLRELD